MGGNSYATNLMQVALPYIPQEKCGYLLGSWNIHEAVICAGYLEGGKDSCQGAAVDPLLQSLTISGLSQAWSAGDTDARRGTAPECTRMWPSTWTSSTNM